MIIINWFEKLFFTYQNSLTSRILVDAFILLKALWIWILAGIFMTAVAKTLVPRERLVPFFTKRQHASILGAAMLGAASPLGTYTVIPLAAGLASAGMPIPALLAFVIASPLIDPNLFFLTAGAMGYSMAFLRLVSAVLLGIAAGYAARLVFRKNTSVLLVDRAREGKGSGAVEVSGAGVIFLRTFFRQGVFIGKTVLLGIVIAALVKNTVSPDWILHTLGRNPLISVVAAAGAGIPLYACGGAAIPVMQQLAEMGLGRGAVLAFFISGPATKISTLVMLKSVFNNRFFWLYLGISLAGAVCFGMVVNLIY
jgi:uncharacterized protein